jgi:hypothetical protein
MPNSKRPQIKIIKFFKMAHGAAATTTILDLAYGKPEQSVVVVRRQRARPDR